MTLFIAIIAPIQVGDGCHPSNRNIGNFRTHDGARHAIDTFLAANAGFTGWVHQLTLSN